jgi:protein O-mannosyl-transferase
VNVAIQVLACLTLFGIVRRTLERRSTPAAVVVAFAISLLWTLHPLLTESITYLAQRAESLMGLFYLLTLYCFVRSASTNGRNRCTWYGFSMAACLLGMGTKEVMVSAPIIVFLYDRTFLAGGFREAWRLRWREFVGLGATWVLLAILVVSTHGRGGSVGFGEGVSCWSYALTQFAAIVHYLRLSFWPHPLIFDYGSGLIPLNFRLLPDMLVILGLVAMTAWALFKRPALGFLGAFFFATLAPSSSIIPIVTETMAEQRMYLPLIPVVVLVVIGIFRYIGGAALPTCLAIAVGLYLATWKRNGDYASEEKIWRDTVTSRPSNERAHYNLGCVLVTIPGRMDEAIAQYEAALRLKPDYAEAIYNLARALQTIPGRLNEAIAHYEDTLRLEPGFAEAYCNLGCALETIPGRVNEAIVHFEAALRLKPDFADAHYDLAGALVRAPGKLSEAIAQYEAALRLRPDFAEARCDLGNALCIAGRPTEAITQYEEVLRTRRDDPAIHLDLAIALLKLPGREKQAVIQLKTVLGLQADNSAARQILEKIGALHR